MVQELYPVDFIEWDENTEVEGAYTLPSISVTHIENTSIIETKYRGEKSEVDKNTVKIYATE